MAVMMDDRSDRPNRAMWKKAMYGEPNATTSSSKQADDAQSQTWRLLHVLGPLPPHPPWLVQVMAVKEVATSPPARA